MADTPAIKILKLPRLPVGWKDQPQLFERYWDEAMSSIEKTLNALLVLPSIQAALEEAQEATAQALAAAQEASGAASNAQDAADQAQLDAQTAKANAAAQAKEASLVNSYPQSIDGDTIISAQPNGNITISTHSRVYGNSTLNPTVTVNNGVFSSGASPGDIVRVYYSQPSRAGGFVYYQSTIDPAVSPAQGVNIHSVGAVQIPTSGSQPGRTPTKPGYVDY